jgi:hypothetical protein
MTGDSSLVQTLPPSPKKRKKTKDGTNDLVNAEELIKKKRFRMNRHDILGIQRTNYANSLKTPYHDNVPPC